MSRPHLTLYGQILLWFFLNLALVAAVLILVLRVQFRVDPLEVLGGRTHEQFQVVARLVSSDLRNAPRDEWGEILTRYDNEYGVRFSLFRPEGDEVMQGEDIVLPHELLEQMRESVPQRERRGVPPSRRGEGGPGAGAERIADDERPGPGERRPPGELRPRPRPRDRGPFAGGEGPRDLRPLAGENANGPRERERERIVRVFYVGRSGEPKRHWAAAMVSLGNREFRHPPDGLLVASTATLGGNRVFYDWRPWLWAIAGVLLVSALIWLPFVGRVSRRLRRLTTATESISEGDFDVAVASTRTDELGRLSRAVQRMADRLDDYMAGQKRFLGDIAHELCSPLARLRMALGVLETRIPEEERANLESLNEEAEALSQLINELLDFSRASIAPGTLPTHEISVPLLLKEVAEREGQGAEVKIEVEAELWITTNRDVLRRALANVVRNANRHAGEAGPIDLQAESRGETLVIHVLDRGPGIPEEWIERVFEPFSRPERARTREGGGAGLGLAIAKTCMEALGGRIRARNRPEGGLAVDLEVRAIVNGSEG